MGWSQNGHKNKTGHKNFSCNPLIYLVGGKGFEPSTSTV